MGLFLFFISAAATLSLTSGAPPTECCLSKSVGGVEYVLAYEGMTSAYHCLKDCVYEAVEHPGSRFCFATGHLPVVCEDVTPTGPPTETTEGPGGASFSFPTECGINYIQPTNVENTSRPVGKGGRIVGGYEAVPGSWPWQAYIKWNESLVCGGTLISDQWVLSAAHCIYGYEEPTNYTIIMGEFDDSVNEGWEQNIDVEKLIVHPNYDDESLDYDFALVKLAQEVELNDHVTPVCFPEVDADLTQDFPPGQICITTGWGSINPAGTEWGPTLKQEYAELWSNEECNESDIYPGWVTDNMICAGFGVTAIEDEERCQSLGYGDSGGPLVCRDSDGKWTHIGATSWGELCYDNYYTPGVFANTISMRQWTVQTLTNN